MEIPDRDTADSLRGTYLEIETPDEPREPDRWFWHELEGLAVRGAGGEELGRITDIYRAGGAEVFVVRGPRGELDIPGVRGIVLELAPDRGEMIVDLDALAIDGRPVEDDEYVRPRDRRPPNPKQPPKPKDPKATPAPPTAETATTPKAPKPGPTSRRGSRPARDVENRVLTADEIAMLRGLTVAPPPGDREPPADAG